MNQIYELQFGYNEALSDPWPDGPTRADGTRPTVSAWDLLTEEGHGPFWFGIGTMLNLNTKAPSVGFRYECVRCGAMVALTKDGEIGGLAFQEECHPEQVWPELVQLEYDWNKPDGTPGFWARHRVRRYLHKHRRFVLKQGS